jgi:predicted dehydrogenase
MASDRIGVGVVGANPKRGWAATAHIPALAALPDYEIRAMSTVTEDVRAVKEAFDVPLVFDDNSEMINRPEVDVVVVAVKVPFHRELVGAALDAGKHVYREWPLGVDLDEAVLLADSARRSAVRTVIGLQNRVTPAVSHVRDLVEQGHIGRVLSTTMTVSAMGGPVVDIGNAYTADRSNGANMLTIALGQGVDALCFALGEWQELSAVLENLTPELTVLESGERVAKTSHDQAAVIGTLLGGALASVHFRGTLAHNDRFHWEINGTEGDLVVEAPGGSPGIFPLTVSSRARTDGELRTLPVAPLQREGIPAGSPANNVAQMYVRLANDLRDGTRTVPTFEDAVTRHRMLAAIEIAALTGTRQSYEQRAA